MRADFFNGVEVVLLNEGTEYAELNAFQRFGPDAIVVGGGRRLGVGVSGGSR